MPLEDLPISFPVPDENAPVKRRAVFSAQIAGLASHHPTSAAEAGGARPRRRRNDDDSLRLIDDLVNRPMDPLFSDSRLVPHSTSAVSVWTTRVIVFVICVAVGFFGCLFVQQLHTDPRREVRLSLASDLEGQTARFDELTGQINDLRSQVDEQSRNLANVYQSETQTQDDMANGVLPVEGEGITLTLANPIAADGSTSGASSSEQIRVVTDADLQQWVSLLWQSGAEAISINGYRLGVQTSIRTAGQTILIGVNSIESPYVIEAIGDRDALASAVSPDSQPALYESYAESGIHPQVSESNSIRLEAAVTGDLSYAKRSEE